MKHVRLVSLVVVLAMAVSPLAVFAQGGDKVELVEAVSEDETLTVSVPADWVITPVEDYPFPYVMAVNTQDAADRFMSEDDGLEEGDQFLMAMVVPVAFLGLMGAALPENATVVDLTAIFATAFIGSEDDDSMDDDDDSESVVGEVEEVELSDDITGAYVTMSDKEAEGAMVGVDLGDDLLAVVIVAAYPGEFTDELADLAKQAAATLEFTGTAEDVMAIFAPPSDGETATGALDGAALVAERCTVCHDTARIDRADKDQAGWTATVDRMIGNGAKLSAAEREAVIAYLVETH